MNVNRLHDMYKFTHNFINKAHTMLLMVTSGAF